MDLAVFVLFDIVDKVLRPVVIVGVHVDDLVGGYSKESPKAVEMIRQLKDTFEFGQWQENEDMIYCGKNVTLKGGEIFISQQMFCENIAIPSIPKSRSADPSQKLMPAEITERLSARGSLNWLIGQTRPDLAASSALC